MKTGESEAATLEGVLVPAAWDSAGEVRGLSLMTFDEAEYRVEAPTMAAHDMARHVRKHVRLVGLVRGGRVVRVSRIEILGQDERRGTKR